MIRVVTIFEDAGGSGWKGRLKDRLFPLPFGFLDRTIVSSEIMRDNLRKLGVSTPIEVIPHGVDLSRFHPLEAGPGFAPVRKRLGLSPGDEVVLFVGPIGERKGVDYLVRAWDRVATARPRAHLLLVGPEKEQGANLATPFIERVRATLRSGQGGERVHFLGPVHDVEEYMRGADVFALPSHREGMPNVVLEAFASGLPCVLTPFQGLPSELGKPGKQYHLVEHDVDLLAERISALLADGPRRRALGNAAMRWALEHLDLEHSLDRLSDVCREVVRTSRSDLSA